MCGALEEPIPAFSAVAGSSPHVRGTFYLELARQGGGGIIPACAGHLSL